MHRHIILLLLLLSAFTLQPAAFSASVPLSFQDNSDNESGFRVERATGATGGTFAQVGTDLPAAPGTGTRPTFTDTTVAVSTTYRYRVLAFNAGGPSGFSNVVTAIVPTPAPNPPSDLVIGTITVAIDDQGNVKAVAVLDTPLGTKRATVSSRIEKKSANPRGARILWEWAIPPRVSAHVPPRVEALRLEQ